MAFVYPFPENINKYTENWLNELLKKIKDNISYYKINVMDNNWIIKNLSITDEIWLNNFKSNINNYKYILLSYNLYPRNIYPIEKEIRWIIFKQIGNSQFECIARPLHKFYNVGEEIYVKSEIEWAEGVPDDDNNIDYYFDTRSKSNIEQKEDWAMIQVFLDNNSSLPNKITFGDGQNIIFNTKNTLAKNIFAQDFMDNFKYQKNIIDGLTKSLIDLKNKYNESVTFIFEYVNPNLETHVVQYAEKRLYLIDIRLNISGKYLSYGQKQDIINTYFANIPEIKLVKKEDILNENQLLEKREEKYIEGYVLKKFEDEWEFFHYAKFKTTWYLNRWFYDGLDVINFSLKDLTILYWLWEEDTFFQKIDNPKNTEMLRKININLSNYKNFINEITNIYQDSLVKNFLQIKDNLILLIDKFPSTIDKRYLHTLECKNDKTCLLLKEITFYLLSIENKDIIDKKDLLSFISENDKFTDLLLDLMYIHIFNLDNNKWKNRKRDIEKIIESAVNSNSFTEWSNKILNKDQHGNYLIFTDKKELINYVIIFLEKLYVALKKVSNQIYNKNFLFIFYNLIYIDIFKELSWKWIDKSTFNLLLNKCWEIIWFNTEYNLNWILVDVNKYKWQSQSSSINSIINKNIIKDLEIREKQLYFDITKDPNVNNLLKLFTFDPQSYKRILNLSDKFVNDIIFTCLIK